MSPAASELSPTFSVIPPDEDAVEEPVVNEISPLELVELPVLKVTPPLESEVDSADERMIDPLDFTALEPLVISTFPPTETADSPPFRAILPPSLVDALFNRKTAQLLGKTTLH